VETQLRTTELSLNAANKQLQASLEQTQQALQRHVQFDDTRVQAFNQLNLPQLVQASGAGPALFASLLQLLEQLVAAFGASHTSLLQLLRAQGLLSLIKGDNAAELQAAFADWQVKAVTAAHSLKSALSHAGTTHEEWSTVIDQFLRFVDSDTRARFFQRKLLELESAQESCPTSTKARNSLISSSHDEMSNIIRTLSQVSSKFVDPDSQADALAEVHQGLHALDAMYKKFVGQATSKVTQSQKLETQTESQNLIKANSVVSSLLGQLTTSFGEVSRSLSTPVTVLIRGAEVALSSVDRRSAEVLSERAKIFLNKTQRAEYQRIPYAEALQNRQSVASFAEEREKLNAELAKLTQKISELELSKGQALSELAASKDHLASKASQVNSLLAELATVRKSRSEARDELPAPAQPEGRYTLTVMDENGKQSNTLGVTAEERSQVAGVRQHFEQKLQQLNVQLQAAQDKATKFFKERQTALEHVVTTAEERDSIQQALERKTEDARKVVEDLETTKQNYEKQLKMFSETFIQKETQLQNILAFKVICKKCKGPNSLQWLFSEDGKNGTRCQFKGCRIDTFLM
jgi:uncharacterized coiled-coil DUF342 family protein